MLTLAQSTLPATVPEWWEQWVPSHQSAFLGIAVTFSIIIIGYIVIYLFSRILRRYSLVTTFRQIAITLAVYIGVIITFGPMNAVGDRLALWTHRAFALIFLLLGLRLLDWLAIKPILTRGGTVPLPKFVHQIVTIVLYVVTGLGFASHTLNWPVAGYLAGAGAVSVILGLALQETMGNFFSGLVLQASQPFKEGDWIEISGLEGRVVGMSWRAVTLHNSNGNYVTIPNAAMARERIINYYSPTRSTSHSFIIILEYQTPPNNVRAILKQTAAETAGVQAIPEPAVLLEDFAAAGMTYRIVFWVDDAAQRKTIEQAVRTNIWYRLRQRGIEIPYAGRPGDANILEKRAVVQRAGDLQNRIHLLKQCQLFSTVPEDQLKNLAEQSSDILLPSGLTLYRQDDAGESLFIVKQGIMDVFIRADDGREHDVGDVLAGQSFGELSAMTGQPRPATLRAQTDATCIEIRREQLNDIFEKNPSIMAAMSQVVANQQKMREDILKRLGAKPLVEPEENEQPNVLAKMKKLFDPFSV